MQILVVGTEDQRMELGRPLAGSEYDFIFMDHLAKDSAKSADAIIDLTFKPETGHIDLLVSLLPGTILINSTVHTISETHPSFVRFNGWPGFLGSTLVEAAAADPQRAIAQTIFEAFGKKPEWLPDEPGFITPRVVSMIINEAYMALEEGVSTRADIDMAMKLGTNYPYGPFEWAGKIGYQEIVLLLQKLALIHPRYQPASLLVSEVP
jgi:3-hydroxybutyryl-CoA dehydrogenase